MANDVNSKLLDDATGWIKHAGTVSELVHVQEQLHHLCVGEMVRKTM